MNTAIPSPTLGSTSNPCSLLALAAALVAAPGCGSDDDDNPDPGLGQVTTYTFTSRFESGVSSVSYSGQVKRHLLITSLGNYLAALNDQTFSAPQPGDVIDALSLFYTFKDFADPSTAIEVNVGAVSALQ